MRSLLLPLVGLSVSGIAAALIFLYLKKAEENEFDFATSRQTVIQMKIPQECIGSVIGRQGSNIKSIQEKSGTRINFKNESEDEKFRVCVIRGTAESAQLAESMIHEFIMNQPLIVSEEMWVPQRACGRIIGRGGETRREISRSSCAKISIDCAPREFDEFSQQRITLKGTPEQIAVAKSLIQEKVDEDAELRSRVENSMANRLPRREPKSTLNYLTAAADEAQKSGKHQTEKLLASGDGFLDVFVSALNHPGQFWVQLVHQKGIELDQLVDKMTDYYSRPENQELHVIKELREGQIVAAPFSHDKKWYRAEVISFKEDEYDLGESEVSLYYVDYGDSSEVKCKQIYEIRTDFLQLYFQAIECFLANVESMGGTWSEDAIDAFEELAHVARWRKKLAHVVTYRASTTKRGDRAGSPVPVVELFDMDMDVNIGEELVKKGFAVYEKGPLPGQNSRDDRSDQAVKSSSNDTGIKPSSVSSNPIEVEHQPSSSTSSNGAYSYTSPASAVVSTPLESNSAPQSKPKFRPKTRASEKATPTYAEVLESAPVSDVVLPELSDDDDYEDEYGFSMG